MHSVYDVCALQQPRSVSDIERSQHRMHLYLLADVYWTDVQHL